MSATPRQAVAPGATCSPVRDCCSRLVRWWRPGEEGRANLDVDAASLFASARRCAASADATFAEMRPLVRSERRRKRTTKHAGGLTGIFSAAPQLPFTATRKYEPAPPLAPAEPRGPRLRRLQVGATGERRDQRPRQRQLRVGRVFHGGCEREVLPERKTNEPSERQLLAREIRFERDQPEPLRLQLDLTAIDVDPCVHPGFVLPSRLCEPGTCRLELGPRRFDASRGRDDLQV